MTYDVNVRAAGPLTLGFSTLGCPGWEVATVVSHAVRWGFDGVEWRGGPEGTVRTDWSTRTRVEARRQIADAGLASIAVTAYTNFLSGDPSTIRASVETARRHLDLAGDLGAGCVRVFLGVRDDDAADDTLRDRATAALRSVIGHARDAGVVVAVEPHDEHVRVSAVEPILAAVPDRSLRVVWDIANAWSAGEDPGDGLDGYAGRIAYVQVKDGTGRGDGWRLRPIGDGDVPLAGALEALLGVAGGMGSAVPPISVEWERAWHPELDPPEVALPAALAHLRAIVAELAAPPAARATG